MKANFSKKELLTLIIASLILGFVFGFDDKQTVFEWSFWFSNYVLFFIISLIALTIFYIAEKKIAALYKTTSSFEIWNIKRLGFAEASRSKNPLYIGLFVPLFLTFLSNGILPFTAVTQSSDETRSSHKLGKTYSRLSEFELSRISVAGPFTLAIFAIIIKLMSNIIPSSDKIIFVSLAIAISNMLPLPKLNGIKAYFGSRLNYVFFLSLIVLIALMISFINAIVTFLLSLIITLIIFILFYKYREVELKG